MTIHSVADAPPRVKTLGTQVFTLVLSIAALSSSWSGVRVASWNLTDVATIIAVVFAAGLSLTIPGVRGLGLWAWLPAIGAFLLVVRDVVLLNRSLTEEPKISYHGDGASPLLMLTRIVISTLLIGICVAVAYRAGGKESLERLLRWWLVGAVLGAFASILQANALFPDFITLQQTVGTTSFRFAGLSSHPNTLAQASALAIPAAAYFFVKSKARGRFLSLAATALLAAGILQSGSRAGLIIGFALLVICTWWSASQVNATRLIIPLTFIAIAVAVVVGPDLIATTRLDPTGESGDESNAGRLYSIGAGWALFAASPFFGSGLGGWIGEMAPVIILASGGIVFFAMYTWFILQPSVRLWTMRREPFAAIALLTVLAVVAFGLLNNGVFERYNFWPMYLGFFAVLGMIPTPRGQGELDPEPAALTR